MCTLIENIKNYFNHTLEWSIKVYINHRNFYNIVLNEVVKPSAYYTHASIITKDTRDVTNRVHF